MKRSILILFFLTSLTSILFLSCEQQPPEAVEKYFKLSIVKNGEGTIDITPESSDGLYLEDTYITIKASGDKENGYYYDSISGDIETTYSDYSFRIVEDTSITVNFPIKTYTFYVETYPPDNGYVKTYVNGKEFEFKDDSEANHTFDYGTKISIEAFPANDGYHFTYFSENLPYSSKEYKNPLTKTLDEDFDFTAYFTNARVLKTSISSDGGGDGFIKRTPDKIGYEDDETVVLEAIPDENSVFIEWQGDIPYSVDKTENPISISMNYNKDIYAVFYKKYNITINQSGDGAGTISTATGSYNYIEGDEVTLSATPNAGSTFSGWSGDYSSYDKDITFTLDSSVFKDNDIEIGAGFKHNIWTVMVYMDGDNNLEENGQADLNEMEDSNLIGSGINVIVLFDKAWSFYGDNSILYQVRYDTSEELSSTELGIDSEEYGEVNMGDPQTAINFIDYCKTSHPADNYAFIVWNHGTGWRSNDRSSTQTDFKAVAIDETSSDDMLYTQELGTIFKGKGIDVIGFDLCLGAMIEEVYEMKDSANYFIGSEELEPGDGWEYDVFFNNFKETDLSQTAFVNSAVEAYATRYEDEAGTTLSGIDLSKIDAVMTTLNTFSNKLYDSISSSEIQGAIQTILIDETENYYTIPGDWNIDLYDAAEKIHDQTDYADSEASALMSAINDAVIAEWHSDVEETNVENTDSNGLSIHLFTRDSENHTGHIPAYIKDYTDNEGNSVDYPLSFVQDSTWVPSIDGTGLLYRLIYTNFE